MFLDIALHQPTTLKEAADLQARLAPDVRLLAGGTDLLVDLKTGRVQATHVVSLNRIAALRGVAEMGGGLRIGALTTVSQLSSSQPIRERLPAVLDATSRMASPQIRNVATIGGNIASAVPCADLPPILMVMNASVVLLSSKGQRNVPLDSFFTGPRDTIRRSDELLTAVFVPRLPSGFGAAYARFALRDGNAVAVASVAASLQLTASNTIRDVRVVLGAVAPTPKLVLAVRSKLIGQAPEEDAFHGAAVTAREEADPISDIRGSADFRREIVEVLARRALALAYDRAKENLS